METTADVAIIGSGPAGSTLAGLLARRGLDVALIDREHFPRDKVCGEFLSYDALPVLERMGILPAIDASGAPHIGRCRVVGRNRDFEFAFPRAARGVSRMLLDDLLFRAAISAGARSFAGATAVAIEPEAGVVTLEANSPLLRPATGDPRSVLRARVLVGAWGRWGRFDNVLRRPFARDRAHRNFGFKRHYRAASPASDVIELYSFARGYLGVSAVEGGITNICGLVHASRLGGHKGRWETFVDAIRKEERVLNDLYAAHEPVQEEFLSSDPVIFRARSPVERGIVMIGDASGVIDPLTGNGMAMAIQSALVAAPHVVDLVAASDRKRIEHRYRRAHAAFFASRIGWSRRVAAVLSRPGLLERAMHVVPGNAVGEFLVGRTRADEGALERLAEAWFR